MLFPKNSVLKPMMKIGQETFFNFESAHEGSQQKGCPPDSPLVEEDKNVYP
jgi:hypothetical protein